MEPSQTAVKLPAGTVPLVVVSVPPDAAYQADRVFSQLSPLALW